VAASGEGSRTVTGRINEIELVGEVASLTKY